jgi:hypothetical protein
MYVQEACSAKTHPLEEGIADHLGIAEGRVELLEPRHWPVLGWAFMSWPTKTYMVIVCSTILALVIVL